jgi:hypothetical protein
MPQTASVKYMKSTPSRLAERMYLANAIGAIFLAIASIFIWVYFPITHNSSSVFGLFANVFFPVAMLLASCFALRAYRAVKRFREIKEQQAKLGDEPQENEPK